MITCSLEVAQLCFICHALYYYTITHYADIIALLRLTWSICAAFGLMGLVGALTQAYMITRIWLIGGRRCVIVPCIILCVLRLLTITTLSAYISHISEIIPLMLNFRTLFIVTSVASGVSDVFISSALTYSLWTTRGGLEKWVIE